MNHHPNAQNKLQPLSGNTFSAKEKDDETGYSYFGARYYDSNRGLAEGHYPLINSAKDYWTNYFSVKKFSNK